MSDEELIEIRNRISELEASSASHTEDINANTELTREHVRNIHTRSHNQAEKVEKEIAELRNLIQGNAISDLNHYSVNENRISELREGMLEIETSFITKLKPLKEDIKYIKQWQEGDCDIKEVLRELNQIVKGINYDLSIRNIFGQDIYNHYSERLAENEAMFKGDRQPGGTGKDSGGEKETNHYSEGDKKNIDYLIKEREVLSRFNPENLSENRIRTKEELERLEGISAEESYMGEDDKPPESTCKHLFEIRGEFEVCTKCGYISNKRIEPREDFYLPDLNAPGLILSGVFKNYIENAYKKLFPDNPPVKREDLQWLYHMINVESNFFDEYPKLKRIKEAYGIE